MADDTPDNGGGNSGGFTGWVKTHKTEAFALGAVGVVAIIVVKNTFFSSGSSSVTPNTSNATIGTDTGASTGGNTSPGSTTGAASNNGGGSGTDPQLNADLQALTAAVDSLVSQGSTASQPSTTNYNYSPTTNSTSTTSNNNVTNNYAAQPASTTTTKAATVSGTPSSSAREAAAASTIPGAKFNASSPPPPLTTKGYVAPLGSSLLSNPPAGFQANTNGSGKTAAQVHSQLGVRPGGNVVRAF